MSYNSIQFNLVLHFLKKSKSLYPSEHAPSPKKHHEATKKIQTCTYGTTCFVEWPVAMEICNWFSNGTMDVLLCTQFVFMNVCSHVDARMCNRL